MASPLAAFTAVFNRFNTRGVTHEDRFLLTRQLFVLQKSGVPLLSSLQALQLQLPSGAMRQCLQTVHRDLLDGRTFSQALARHPKVFTPVFLGMIRAGEAGGLLDEVLKELALLFEWEIEFRRRLREAIQYPIIVICTLSVALTLMVIFVLPQFAKLFESFQIPLPIQTRMLIALSHFISRFGWLVALLSAGAVAGWTFYIRTPAGRLRWDRWKLHLPIAGPLFLQLAMSRFARSMSSLSHCGVPILETLSLARDSVINRFVRTKLDAVRTRVKGGEALASALRSQPMFPAIIVQMVATGEQTGNLPELLRSIAEYYEDQMTYTVKQLLASLEPLLLVVVSLGVLMMASAVFIPMWDLVKVFKEGG